MLDRVWVVVGMDGDLGGDWVGLGTGMKDAYLVLVIDGQPKG
jgi:hypothetical protein